MLFSILSTKYYHVLRLLGLPISATLQILVYRIFFVLIDLFAILSAWPLTIWELWLIWAPLVSPQRLPLFFFLHIRAQHQTSICFSTSLLTFTRHSLQHSALLNYAKIAYSTDILPIHFTGCCICVLHTGDMFSWNDSVPRYHLPKSSPEIYHRPCHTDAVIASQSSSVD